jgi:hypothetical protein
MAADACHPCPRYIRGVLWSRKADGNVLVHGMTCCCAHARLHVFGDAVKTVSRRRVHHVALDSEGRVHIPDHLYKDTKVNDDGGQQRMYCHLNAMPLELRR